MPRRRDPEGRRAEIEKAGEELFLAQGYEATTVEHILQRTGLSKGGFYHHFKSKEDVLLQLLDNITAQAVVAAQEIADRPDLSALQKLEVLFQQQAEFKLPKASLIRAFYKEHGANPQLHRYIVRMWENYLPVFTQIVKQGVAEGSMTATYPEETVRLLLGTIASLHDVYDLGTARPADGGDLGEAERYIEALEELITRTLGLSGSQVQVLGSDMLKELF